MKTCLVITDSVGFPRQNPYTPFDKTWLGLLEPILNSKEYVIYTFQKKGLTTERIIEELKDHLNYINPDLLILQVGIVDCSPRALKESELFLFKKIPIVRNIVRSLVKRFYRRISQIRNLCYIEINQFENNLNIIAASFINAQKIIIPIGLASDEYIKKSPLIEKRINDYNLILKKIFKNQYLDEYHKLAALQIDRIYTEDFYHLNHFGHNILYESLLKKL